MPPAKQPGRWILPTTVASDARSNVFCFPYAGGGASFYRGWAAFAPPRIALVPVQLPGREERFTERTFDRMADLVAAAAEHLQPFLAHPYALLGHSMGAIVCYELAHALRERGAPLPVHLFVSGAPAPHLARTIPTVYDVPEPRFLDEVRGYGGLNEEVLQSRELMDLLIPRLRADLAVTGTYEYAGRPPLPFPITAFGGLADQTVAPELVDEWREHTTAAFRCRLFPGGHFFIAESAREIVSEIAGELG
jgi:medium-chain acyl-[acyl-carrier-protein] hydrolase